MLGASACSLARQYLSMIIDKLLQEADIFIVNIMDIIVAKITSLLSFCCRVVFHIRYNSLSTINNQPALMDALYYKLFNFTLKWYVFNFDVFFNHIIISCRLVNIDYRFAICGWLFIWHWRHVTRCWARIHSSGSI